MVERRKSRISWWHYLFFKWPVYVYSSPTFPQFNSTQVHISLPIKSMGHGNYNLSRVDKTKDLTKFVLKLHLASRWSCPNGNICRCKNMNWFDVKCGGEKKIQNIMMTLFVLQMASVYSSPTFPQFNSTQVYISLPIKSMVHGNNNLSRVDETKDLTKFVLKLHLASRWSCPNGSICRCKNMITDLT